MNAWVLVLWPLSCVICLVAGAAFYHGVRILSSRPVYRINPEVQRKALERQKQNKDDVLAKGAQYAYLSGLHLTGDEYRLSPEGKAK